MSLNSGIAYTAFKTQVKNELGIDIDQDAIQKSMFEILLKVLIAHIKQNAVVNTNVNVTSVSGVTTGAGVSGPGNGVGVGTID